MKERPILFNGEMVRAILDGRKTQTRRVVNWKQLHKKAGLPYPTVCRLARFAVVDDWALDASDGCMRVVGCPFGVPGDRLWVRETWKPTCTWGTEDPSYVRYRAGSDNPFGERLEVAHDIQGVMTDPWRPSIHMPRWASRITLEVVSVRVERVQDISEEDAIAEGLPRLEDHPYEDHVWCPSCQGQGVHPAFGADYGVIEVDCADCDTYQKMFRNLWDGLNAKRGHGWEKNPWVWIVDFRIA